MDAERIWEKCLCPRIKATEPVSSGCGRWLMRYCFSLKCSVLGEFEAGTWLLWRRELRDKCQAVTMWPYHASPNETKSYFLREETANNQIRVGNRCHKFHRLSQSLWQNLTFYRKDRRQSNSSWKSMSQIPPSVTNFVTFDMKHTVQKVWQSKNVLMTFTTVIVTLLNHLRFNAQYRTIRQSSTYIHDKHSPLSRYQSKTNWVFLSLIEFSHTKLIQMHGTFCIACTH